MIPVHHTIIDKTINKWFSGFSVKKLKHCNNGTYTKNHLNLETF